MNRIAKIFVLPVLLAFGCDGGGGSRDMAMAAADMAISMAADMAMIPAAPTLGAQIERMGRPTINVAVTDPFNLMNMQDKVRDDYNKDGDPTKWVANWKNVLRGNLALYDGIDGMCGNQLAADPAKMDPTRYDTLATILADDRLWIDTSKMSCNFYLAVEAAALMVPVMECGGRLPTLDVVDETYTAAAVGLSGFMMDGTFAVKDGVSKDGDNGMVNATTFPFLPDPNP